MALRKDPFPFCLANFCSQCKCLLFILTEATGTCDYMSLQVHVWCQNALVVTFAQSPDLPVRSAQIGQNHSFQSQKD